MECDRGPIRGHRGHRADQSLGDATNRVFSHPGGAALFASTTIPNCAIRPSMHDRHPSSNLVTRLDEMLRTAEPLNTGEFGVTSSEKFENFYIHKKQNINK